MAFRSKLARHNTCCEQVMPVPVIPLCAISCTPPKPIYEIQTNVYTYAEAFQSGFDPSNIYTYDEAYICSNPPNVYTCEEAYKCPPIPGLPFNQILEYTLDMEPPTSGTVFASETIPIGYLLCNGTEQSRIEYRDLFNAIGIKYGNGNGETTFNLPDLKDLKYCSNSTLIFIIKT